MRITTEKFLSVLKKKTKNATFFEVKEAWNAMLLDLPENRLTLIQSLKKKYSVYILSNTNTIHIDAFKKNPFKVNKIYKEYFVGKGKHCIYCNTWENVSYLLLKLVVCIPIACFPIAD